MCACEHPISMFKEGEEQKKRKILAKLNVVPDIQADIEQQHITTYYTVRLYSADEQFASTQY